eukprot:4722042-Pyramimonas_sp.AAC.1
MSSNGAGSESGAHSTMMSSGSKYLELRIQAKAGIAAASRKLLCERMHVHGLHVCPPTSIQRW